MISSNHDLHAIAEKLRGGGRLSAEDGRRLFACSDIHAIGQLAHEVRQRKHARRCYYNINRHINYTNYCILRCKFCSFYRPWSRQEVPDGGYQLSLEELIARAGQAASAGATEVHIVGGLHPRLPFEYYLELCRGIKSACPRLHLKGFTAIEIIHFSRIAKPRRTIRQVLEELREAGLDSLPGGGAEIFDDRVHAETFKNKVGEQGWFDVHRTAHELGIYSNATMLYGHIETPAERINHLIKLREHQDRSLAEGKAHFNCVVPLPFIPQGSALADLPGPSGLDSLKTLAISRLMLDNVAHVKAFWVMQSPKLAQISLNWGVDDLDGTVVYYDITKTSSGGGSQPLSCSHEPGYPRTHQELTVEQIRRLIIEAGGEPVERDTLYRPVTRRGNDWSVESGD